MSEIILKAVTFSGLQNEHSIFFTDQKESMKSVAYTLNWQLSKKRSGSAKTKAMHEISGTTAKPYKQKGTGHARQGSKRSVQFRGGRTCFGPVPRSFEYSLPKKIIKKSIFSALKLKLRNNKLILLSGISDNYKTSGISKIFIQNSINSALILYDKSDLAFNAFIRSVKNIENIKALDYKATNTYDLLRFDFLILSEKTLEAIKEKL